MMPNKIQVVSRRKPLQRGVTIDVAQSYFDSMATLTQNPTDVLGLSDDEIRQVIDTVLPSEDPDDPEELIRYIG